MLYQGLSSCGEDKYPLLFNPRLPNKLPAHTQLTDLKMTHILIDALSHKVEKIRVPSKMGKKFSSVCLTSLLTITIIFSDMSRSFHLVLAKSRVLSPCTTGTNWYLISLEPWEKVWNSPASPTRGMFLNVSKLCWMLGGGYGRVTLEHHSRCGPPGCHPAPWCSSPRAEGFPHWQGSSSIWSLIHLCSH